MGDLSKYLAMKLEDGRKSYQIIYIAGPSADLHMALSDTMSISDICESFWNRSEDLVLHYRLPRQQGKVLVGSESSKA
jgi:hypothetical protein